MDRRNGGDPLAPPRPPKLLPRVHRPRAPEPTMISEANNTAITTTTTTPAATQTSERTHATTATVAAAAAATATIPQCTNSQGVEHQQQPQPHLSSSSNNNLSQQQLHSITTTATSNIINNNSNNLSGNIASGSSNNNNNYNFGNAAVITTQPEFDDYQIHHLTFLPQRPSSLSRNSSHVSNASSSSSAANSFTRRRPPPTPGAAVPLLNINGSASSNSNNSSGGNFLSQFHSATTVPTSPVTLAQPRPESERLTNEYVDTPLRTAQQLQHASRAQHPAGQHDNGQTTTHHLLLLPQRELRLQQQQQQHSSRVVGPAGSANTALGTDGTDGFLHSHNHNHHQNKVGTTTTAAQTTTCLYTGKVTPPPPPPRVPGVQPITQPITKQPASSTASASFSSNSTGKFTKDLPALDELLDLHHIATGISTPQGIISAVNGASPLGTPIVNGGDPSSSLNRITCPRCGRCRCEQCQSPRPLPETWVCNKTCLCSAESVIDYASCLCCAKALFYHCARDNDMDCDDGSGTPCVDNPCSCGPYKRTQRWGWLGALSLVLPCLWCYWPMRGCIALCEKCYGRYAGHGCRCQQIGSTSSMLPIVPLGDNGNSIASNGNNVQNGGMGGGQSATKSVSGSGVTSNHHHHHHHHHSECSAASRILRKGDLTPEKRLLDSSPEY